jgi:hypothetical protein
MAPANTISGARKALCYDARRFVIASCAAKSERVSLRAYCIAVKTKNTTNSDEEPEAWNPMDQLIRRHWGIEAVLSLKRKGR